MNKKQLEKIKLTEPNYKIGDIVTFKGPGVGSPYYPKKTDKYKVTKIYKANNGHFTVNVEPIGHEITQPTNLADEFKKESLSPWESYTELVNSKKIMRRFKK